MAAHTLDTNLIIGKKYNRLTILEYYPANDRLKALAKVLCRCDCGNLKTTSIQVVRDGRCKSCGCYNKQIISKHLLSKSAEYRAWSGMKQRCTYAKRHDYDRYGGRGIRVCDRWLNSFENFIQDMGRKPSATHSLDRIDNEGNYEPSNCRWATIDVQNNNKSLRKINLIRNICAECKKEYFRKNSVAIKSKYCSKICFYNFKRKSI